MTRPQRPFRCLALAFILAGCPGRESARDSADAELEIAALDANIIDAAGLDEIALADSSDANSDIALAGDALDAAADTQADSAIAPDVEFDSGPEIPGTVRIIAGNLTSGTAQSYTPGHGIRIFQGLHPDIVLIQEFNYGTNTPVEHRAFVDMAFGPTFEYWRGTGDIPNGVISRYHIVASGDWVDPYVANRAFSWARINVPGAHDLWAIAVHLLSSGGTQRANEATALVTHIHDNVPSDDLLVIGGDMNTETRVEGCVATLAVVVGVSAPYPTDETGNTNTNSPRARPYDWLLADSDLAATEVPVMVGAGMFVHGLVFDSRVYSLLTDVAPVMASDSAAVNMQHMAVVRDFRLGF